MTESGWLEVGPGVFQRRYDPMDVSVVVVIGPTGLTVVDTRNNPAEADEVIRDIARRFDQPIVAVVNRARIAMGTRCRSVSTTRSTDQAPMRGPK